MKTYAKIILVALGFSFMAISCECKACKKDGANEVKVCRDNYSSDDDYNDAIGFYQLDGYNCN